MVHGLTCRVLRDRRVSYTVLRIRSAPFVWEVEQVSVVMLYSDPSCPGDEIASRASSDLAYALLGSDIETAAAATYGVPLEKLRRALDFPPPLMMRLRGISEKYVAYFQASLITALSRAERHVEDHMPPVIQRPHSRQEQAAVASDQGVVRDALEPLDQTAEIPEPLFAAPVPLGEGADLVHVAPRPRR